MQYRRAKLLKAEDIVFRKSDNAALTVVDIEVYGSVKTVRINCKDNIGTKISLLNNELQ